MERILMSDEMLLRVDAGKDSESGGLHIKSHEKLWLEH